MKILDLRREEEAWGDVIAACIQEVLRDILAIQEEEPSPEIFAQDAYVFEE